MFSVPFPLHRLRHSKLVDGQFLAVGILTGRTNSDSKMEINPLVLSLLRILMSNTPRALALLFDENADTTLIHAALQIAHGNCDFKAVTITTWTLETVADALILGAIVHLALLEKPSEDPQNN